MNALNKDRQILRHILTHCERIESTVERFGKDKGLFMSDRDYIDSVSMNLLQIGELVGRFTEEYSAKTQPAIDWRAIKGMRNLFAHAYGSMDVERIWDTVIMDIPLLKSFCADELEQSE